MTKILIAINNDFIRSSYVDIFQLENFEVLKTGNGKEALALISTEKPDIIIADVNLAEINGFDLMANLKQDPEVSEIPVIIFTQFEGKDDRAMAIELEAKDFISAADIPPKEVVARVKIALGEQRTYRLSIRKNLYNAKELISDFGHTYDLKCPECGEDLILYLMRDLSKGDDYFKVSIICPNCG